MPSEYVDADRFGSELTSILGDIGDAVDDKMPEVMRKGAKVGRREWRANAPKKTGDYASSISYRVKKSGSEVSAEIGSATLPGLPHLLEKGHAKVGGGRVAPRVHIAPAADDAFDATYDAALEAIDEAIAKVAS